MDHGDFLFIGLLIRVFISKIKLKFIVRKPKKRRLPTPVSKTWCAVVDSLGIRPSIALIETPAYHDGKRGNFILNRPVIDGQYKVLIRQLNNFRICDFY